LLHFAACLGNIEIVEILTKSKQIDIDVADEETGVNAFWMAAFYGRGEAASLLATKGIDILSKHKET
jgi:ankyrin repeat protein